MVTTSLSIFLLIFSLLSTSAYSIFCSAYCKPNSCSGITKTQCTACDAPFLLSSGQCVIDTTSGYSVAAESHNFTISPTGTASCGTYTFTGTLQSGQTFTATTTAPIITPHIKVRLIFWVILYEDWNTVTDYIEAKISTTNATQRFNVVNRQANQQVCGPGQFESNIKFDLQFIHSDTTSPFNFQIYTYQSGGSQRWGIKDQMILIINCHTYCLSCTEVYVNTCTACNNGYKLSGTICATTCLTGYGQTTNATLCVLCDLKCVMCFETSTNCSSCTPTAPNQAFLYINQCFVTCPAGTIKNSATHVCDPCTNPACVSCSQSNATQCFSCNSTTYWQNFDCITQCPVGTYPNSPNCTTCHTSCAVCTNSPTPCTVCNTGYKLSGTTCATSCLAGYGQTTNASLCVLCDLKCVVCYQLSTNCSSCTPNAPNEAFLYGMQCMTTCPAGYFGDVITHTCLMCSNDYCLSCNPTNLSQCYNCNSSSFWYSFDCILTCPLGTYPNLPNCTTCDTSCAICTNSPTPCTLCNTGYKLSGTTCATTCLTQYGSTTNTSFCVLCDVKCVVCYQLSTNCSLCTPTAPNEAFLYGTQCMTACPTGYLADTITHRCLLCINPDCSSCSTTNLSQCYQCNSPTYWYSFDCISTCPIGTFPNSPNCTVCDISCLECTGSPSPCSICKPTYYFISNSCLSACPADYFQHNPSMTCKNCSLECVTASVIMSFPQENQLQITISFSRPLDFSTFPYITFQILNITDPSISLSQFTITYTVASDRSYKIILTPISDLLLLDNVPFVVEINNIYTNPMYSQDGYLFSETIFTLNTTQFWTITQKKQRWQLQDLEYLNNWLNAAFTQPWVQQIKKTGVFAILFPGAQLCSTIILHNATPPVNMYEAARFWGTFIYFQVPKWQQNGSSLKRVFSELIKQMLQTNSRRILQTTSQQQKVNWRFERTGHTGYFIFDAYIPLLIIICTWVPILILFIVEKRFSKNTQKIRKLKTIFYSILHRLHEVCMFYLLLAVSLDWMYLTTHSFNTYKYVSFAAGVIFVFYCLIYQIHAFYKIIPYTYTDISSKKFDFYVEQYSFFLRDIRFEQYGLYPRWHCIHFLRPYNYQVLSFFRLALILCSLPLFQDIIYGCVSCLLVFQTIQIIRFMLTWPYYTPWRNYYKLTLQVVLLMIFLLYLIADIIYRKGFQMQGASIRWSSTYLGVGWVGFILLFIYNVLYFVYFLIDVVVGCIYTNRQRMEFARNTFYRQMLQDFETCQDIYNPTLKQSEAHNHLSSSIASSKKGYVSLINSLHKAEPALQPKLSKNPKQTIELIAHRGNLCEHDYQKFWKIKVKIEQYQICQAGQNKYTIKYEKVKDLYMHLNPDIGKKNNLLMPLKKCRQVKITPHQNQFYYKLVDSIYSNYRTVNTEVVIIRTYLKVDQNLYKPGQRIFFNLQQMSQEIQIKNQNGTNQRQKLGKVLKGFPVPQELLNLL